MHFLKLVFLVGMSLRTAPALAHELVIPPARYPVVTRAGQVAQDFVPEGWKIERQAHGDISGDGRTDLALVIKQADPRFIFTNDSFGVPRLDTNPRILIIALGSNSGYRLAVANYRLIPRHEVPTLSDPFGEDGDLSINRGALKIGLYHFANMGGWDAGPTKFTFRWQNGALRLIGYDKFNVKRNSGEVTGLSINFLTGRVKEERGTIDQDESRVRWHRLPSRKLPTINEIGAWDEYDPGGWFSKLFG